MDRTVAFIKKANSYPNWTVLVKEPEPYMYVESDIEYIPMTPDKWWEDVRKANQVPTIIVYYNA